MLFYKDGFLETRLLLRRKVEADFVFYFEISSFFFVKVSNYLVFKVEFLTR